VIRNKEDEMSDQSTVKQEERVLAALAHGSVLLAPFSNGIGGALAALVIWLVQREKSAYAAYQALQALVYQVVALVVTMVSWCCWGVVWFALWFPALIADPEAYSDVPPAGMWIGLLLMVVPLLAWGLMTLYGLWGAARTLGGHDFQYAIIGRWLKKASPAN